MPIENRSGSQFRGQKLRCHGLLTSKTSAEKRGGRLSRFYDVDGLKLRYLTSYVYRIPKSHGLCTMEKQQIMEFILD